MSPLERKCGDQAVWAGPSSHGWLNGFLVALNLHRSHGPGELTLSFRSTAISFHAALRNLYSAREPVFARVATALSDGVDVLDGERSAAVAARARRLDLAITPRGGR